MNHAFRLTENAGSLQFTVLPTKLTLSKMHTSLLRSYQTASCISLKELIIYTIIIKTSYPQLLSVSSRKPLTTTRLLLARSVLRLCKMFSHIHPSVVVSYLWI